MNFINITKPGDISGLTKFIGTIITSFGSVALGIILFTVFLKLLTLVLDYFSRASMRRSSLKMKQMRPQLEKLQQQFKNNKQLYQQKVMELYKKEGYSVFSSCLPTIVTLVLFIIVLNNFQSYSEFSNKQDIYSMAESYNSVVLDGFTYDDDIVKRTFDGKQENIVIDFDALNLAEGRKDLTNSEVDLIWEERENNKYAFSTTDGYAKVVYTKTNTGFTRDGFEVNNIPSAKCNEFKTKYGYVEGTDFNTFVKGVQEQLSADTYKEERNSFFWVKNIWVQDRADKSPIQEYGNIKGLSDVITEANYNAITVKLESEKSQANGYYILVAISILITFLSQFIMMKSNKDQMELQSVDGQGVATQKMMLWLMPIMMAIFAFIYTAAFSLYIITSTILSILTNIGINKIVDYQFKRKNFKETENIIRRG